MTERLVAELDEARASFLDALADVDVALVTAPGVVEEWSVRDLVVHVAAWCRHGAEALDLATAGRGGEFAYSTDETDAMNERFLAEGRTVSPADALAREEAAYGALRERVAALDPSVLRQRLGNGDTVEAVIRYDGPDHYAEHTEHLRAWFGAPDADEDDGEDDEESRA